MTISASDVQAMMIDAVAKRLKENFGGSWAECEYEAKAICTIVIKLMLGALKERAEMQ